MLWYSKKITLLLYDFYTAILPDKRIMADTEKGVLDGRPTGALGGKIEKENNNIIDGIWCYFKYNCSK